MLKVAGELGTLTMEDIREEGVTLQEIDRNIYKPMGREGGIPIAMAERNLNSL